MGVYIKLSDAKDEFYYTLADKDCVISDYREAYELLDGVEAADVRPVVRGRWIESYSGWTPTKKCSACDVHFTQFPMKTVVKGEPIKPVLNFCPNCGADMREAPNEP